MKIEAQKLMAEARIPQRDLGDMCFDFFTLYTHAENESDPGYPEHGVLLPHRVYKVHTGIALALPKGFGMTLEARSGVAWNFGLQVLGGQIDNTYRGEIMGLVQVTYPMPYQIYDRMFQGKLISQYDEAIMVDTDTLTETDRQDAGFGASGS